jgi:hypothetical protein
MICWAIARWLFSASVVTMVPFSDSMGSSFGTAVISPSRRLGCSRLTFHDRYDDLRCGADLGNVGSRKSDAWTILERE